MRHRVPALMLATGVALAAVTISAASATLAAPTASGNLFASVSINGTLVTGQGVTSVTHINTGQYEVTFSRDVRQLGPFGIHP